MNSRSALLQIKNLFALLSLCFCVYANGSEQGIHQIIENHVLKEWQQSGAQNGDVNKVIIHGLPAGYQAPNCPTGYAIQLLGNDLTPGRNSLYLSCPTLPAWSLTLTADLQVWREVVTSQNIIRRNTRLSTNMLSLQKRNIGTLHRGYFQSFDDVTGMISKRSLKPGLTILPSMVENPVIIQRGQLITLQVNSTAIKVEMAGEALQKGRLGDLIKVKNTSSKKTLQGRIVSSDVVIVQ